MSDGAHLGIDAQSALETVLGGNDEPDESVRRRTPEEMAEWLRTARPAADFDRTDFDRDDGYEECARTVGGEILRWAEDNPERYAAATMDDDYDWEGDPDHGSKGQKPEFLKAKGLYPVLKDEGVALGGLGISGFMWGWAWNAAAYALGREASDNPAIMEIDTDER